MFASGFIAADTHTVFCCVQHSMDFSSSGIFGSWLTDRGKWCGMTRDPAGIGGSSGSETKCK